MFRDFIFTVNNKQNVLDKGMVVLYTQMNTSRSINRKKKVKNYCFLNTDKYHNTIQLSHIQIYLHFM